MRNTTIAISINNDYRKSMKIA